ncbi:hypothetical protein ACFX11_032813 [Malus domestica]
MRRLRQRESKEESRIIRGEEIKGNLRYVERGGLGAGWTEGLPFGQLLDKAGRDKKQCAREQGRGQQWAVLAAQRSQTGQRERRNGELTWRGKRTKGEETEHAAAREGGSSAQAVQ